MVSHKTQKLLYSNVNCATSKRPVYQLFTYWGFMYKIYNEFKHKTLRKSRIQLKYGLWNGKRKFSYKEPGDTLKSAHRHCCPSGKTRSQPFRDSMSPQSKPPSPVIRTTAKRETLMYCCWWRINRWKSVLKKTA